VRAGRPASPLGGRARVRRIWQDTAAVCGKRSAYSRPGGAESHCYVNDIPATEIQRYRSINPKERPDGPRPASGARSIAKPDRPPPTVRLCYAGCFSRVSAAGPGATRQWPAPPDHRGAHLAPALSGRGALVRACRERPVDDVGAKQRPPNQHRLQRKSRAVVPPAVRHRWHVDAFHGVLDVGRKHRNSVPPSLMAAHTRGQAIHFACE
jgi:hypothetical protein